MNPYAKQFDLRQRHRVASISLQLQVLGYISGSEEGVSIDFKQYGAYTAGEGKSKERARSDLLDDIISLSNKIGGRIIIGVKERKPDGPPHIITGIPDDKLDSYRSSIRDMATRFLLPDSHYFQIHTVRIHDSTLLVLDIVQCRSGPAHYLKDHGHIIKIREGDQNRLARIDEIDSLLRSRPIPVARQRARAVASQLSRNIDKGSIRGILISNLDDWDEKVDGIAKSQFGPNLERVGFAFLSLTEPDLIDFDIDSQDSVPWVLGSEVRLNSDFRPNCIYMPGQKAAFYFMAECTSQLDQFNEICEQAGRLILEYGNDLLVGSGFWSGIDARTLRSPKTAWLVMLSHWQIQNSPNYIWREFFSGHSSNVFGKIDEIQTRGYIDPRHDSFALPFSDDLRSMSLSILNQIA